MSKTHNRMQPMKIIFCWLNFWKKGNTGTYFTNSGLHSYMWILLLSLNITLLNKGYDFLIMASYYQLSYLPGLFLTGLTAYESLFVENALSVYVLTNRP